MIQVILTFFLNPTFKGYQSNMYIYNYDLVYRLVLVHFLAVIAKFTTKTTHPSA